MTTITEGYNTLAGITERIERHNARNNDHIRAVIDAIHDYRMNSEARLIKIMDQLDAICANGDTAVADTIGSDGEAMKQAAE